MDFRAELLELLGEAEHLALVDAGEAVLAGGGSAVDAAIAANAVLGLVEPMSCGLGGDLMAMIWSEHDQSLHGYNGAGRASMDFPLEELNAELLRLGREFIPTRGPLGVTVPGAAQARIS